MKLAPSYILLLGLFVTLFGAESGYACRHHLSLQGYLPAGFRLVDLGYPGKNSYEKIAPQILELAAKLEREERAWLDKAGPTTWITRGELDTIAIHDRETRFSKVLVDQTGRVIAFLLARDSLREGYTLISKLGVETEFRSQNMATLLMLAVAITADEADRQWLYLGVYSTNARAIGFYRKLRFDFIKSDPCDFPPATADWYYVTPLALRASAQRYLRE